jgi:hypothetical protein
MADMAINPAAFTRRRQTLRVLLPEAVKTRDSIRRSTQAAISRRQNCPKIGCNSHTQAYVAV